MRKVTQAEFEHTLQRLEHFGYKITYVEGSTNSRTDVHTPSRYSIDGVKVAQHWFPPDVDAWWELDDRAVAQAVERVAG